MKHIIFIEVDVDDFDRRDFEEMRGVEYNSVAEIYEAFDPDCKKNIQLYGIEEHLSFLNDEEYPRHEWITFVYLNHEAKSEYGIDFCDRRRNN